MLRLASMSWKNNSASASCNFGNGNGTATSNALRFTRLQTKLWIYGGTPTGMTTMNSASDIDDVSINLDPWVESLEEKSIALATIANSYKIIGL